jgi:hypothetical protein
MEKKGKKNHLNEELNELFEKIINSGSKRLQNVEELRRSLMQRLDQEISRLYAKKDFLADIWNRREELRLEKIGVWRKFRRTSWAWFFRYLLSAPFIYMMIIPALTMHAFLEIYHRVCFRLYGIPLVKPHDYFIFDRRLLPYLNWLEKFNCCYCSYFNGLAAYTKEIAGRTERYWCPIKHSRVMKDKHSQYEKFVDYSDGKELRKRWAELRKY